MRSHCIRSPAIRSPRHDGGSALVVDGSTVSRQLITRFLSTRYSSVDAAASVEEGERCCEGGPRSLVVLDATLDGSIEWLSGWPRSASRPAFVVVTTRPCVGEETRVTMMGAIGYLAKPLTFQSLAKTLVASAPAFTRGAPRVRVLPIARVFVLDAVSGERQLSCDVRNLGLRGAFLEAAAPIAAGTSLRIVLTLGAREVALQARVVRVQEPRWGVPCGWGVLFESMDVGARRAVEDFVLRSADA